MNNIRDEMPNDREKFQDRMFLMDGRDHSITTELME